MQQAINRNIFYLQACIIIIKCMKIIYCMFFIQIRDDVYDMFS